MTDRDIFLIEVARRGRDGDYAGASEVAALDTRVDALEARPIIDSIDDIMSGATAGQVPIKQSSGEWGPGVIDAGIRMRTDADSEVVANATTIWARAGVAAVEEASNPNLVYLTVQFGGTGTTQLAARSDHNHTLTSPTRATFGPQAYMSSGTRNLTSTSVVLPAGITCVVKARLNMQMRGGDPGPCYYQLRLTINGNARTSPGETLGFWCVQGVPDKVTWEHHLAITGTGAAVSVSADAIYHSGGGFYTDAGEIVVEVDTAR